MGLQFLCNGFQWESGLERLPPAACVHAWPGWHSGVSLVPRLALCTHAPPGLSISEVAVTSRASDAQRGRKVKLQTIQRKPCQPDRKGHIWEIASGFCKSYLYSPPAPNLHLLRGVHLSTATITFHFIWSITFSRPLSSLTIHSTHSINLWPYNSFTRSLSQL